MFCVDALGMSVSCMTVLLPRKGCAAGMVVRDDSVVLPSVLICSLYWLLV